MFCAEMRRMNPEIRRAPTEDEDNKNLKGFPLMAMV
jgi:hypothetical protein